MKSKRDYSQLIIWASVAVSVPRYIGAFVASDVGNVTGWLSELLTALSLFSGFGMGLLDVIASAYLFDGWRQTLPRLDRRPSLRWWILTCMVIGLMGIGVVILVPYVVARVKHESMEAVMPGAFLYLWSVAVVIAPLFIIGGVSFAQRNVVQSEGPTKDEGRKGIGETPESSGNSAVSAALQHWDWRQLSDDQRHALVGKTTKQIMELYPGLGERSARGWREAAGKLNGHNQTEDGGQTTEERTA